MKILLLLMPLLLFSVEPSIMEVPRLDQKYSNSSTELSKKSFTYVNPGVTTIVPLMFETKIHNKIPALPSAGNRDVTAKDRLSWILPDLSFGMRTLSSHHVFDRAVGMIAHPEVQMLYVQGSYLFFPTSSKGVYFGTGLTCGIYHIEDKFIPSPSIYVNLPITLGYQFPSNKSFQFIQIQGTPFGSGTISYGVGF